MNSPPELPLSHFLAVADQHRPHKRYAPVLDAQILRAREPILAADNWLIQPKAAGRA